MVTKAAGKTQTTGRKTTTTSGDVREAQAALQKAYQVHSLAQATFQHLTMSQSWPQMHSPTNVPFPHVVQTWGGMWNDPSMIDPWSIMQQSFRNR